MTKENTYSFVLSTTKRLLIPYDTTYLELILGSNSRNTNWKQYVRQGVGQGYILSPMLFNLYMERAFRIARENNDIGVEVNAGQNNNLRYADDTALIADTAE